MGYDVITTLLPCYVFSADKQCPGSLHKAERRGRVERAGCMG
jgi:hypothetical protein